MHDIEIKNASIIDGLGNEAYQGNLYVKDKKISAITYGETLESKLSINATGKVLTPGYAADLVILNPGKIKEKSTFLNPHQYPEGITNVIVNGEFVINDGEFTGKTPGGMITDFNS